MRVRLMLPMVAAAALFAAVFLPLGGGIASAQQDQGVKDQFLVTVTSDQLNVRTEPNTSSSIVLTLDRGEQIWTYGQTTGEEVSPHNVVWFKTRSGYYIYSGNTNLGDISNVLNSGISGRWVEVDRGPAIARAVDNGTVVHIAASTVGTPEFPTPLGTFHILRRVENETMDSATIGIPRDAPHGYYLTGVLYTQYITDGGAALHYNYWSPADAFGTGTGSHGCVGLELDDAAYFWNFAGVGTPVVINP